MVVLNWKKDRSRIPRPPLPLCRSQLNFLFAQVMGFSSVSLSESSHTNHTTTTKLYISSQNCLFFHKTPCIFTKLHIFSHIFVKLPKSLQNFLFRGLKFFKAVWIVDDAFLIVVGSLSYLFLHLSIYVSGCFRCTQPASGEMLVRSGLPPVLFECLKSHNNNLAWCGVRST